MKYIHHYQSPLGAILLAADDIGLTGLWFEGQKHFASPLENNPEEKDLPIFDNTKKWLNQYFSGHKPNIQIPIHFIGTKFQLEVWNILNSIPYGKTITYGDIAKQIAANRGLKSMSAQAVGNAVGRNPISIIVPCHRVVGTNGKLTGFAGGIDKKIALLNLENSDFMLLNK